MHVIHRIAHFFSLTPRWRRLELWVSKLPRAAQSLSLLKNELQPELHGLGVGLNTGDLAERAPKTVHPIRTAIRIGMQAPFVTGYPQVHMVEEVVHLEPKLQVLRFREFEVFAYGGIRAPEARLPSTSEGITSCPQAPEFIVLILLGGCSGRG